MLSGLLIRSPYIDWILAGSKTWVGVKGPLTRRDLVANAPQTRLEENWNLETSALQEDVRLGSEARSETEGTCPIPPSIRMYRLGESGTGRPG